MIKLPVFKKKKCSYLYNNLNFTSLNENKNCKIFHVHFVEGFTTPQSAQLHWEQTTLIHLLIALLGSQCTILFFQPLVNADFFISGIDPDILMNVLKYFIIFLIWASWVLFNFHLKQKQRFSVWSFTETVSLISSHGRIWSRYSETHLKKAKTYLSKNDKNTP